MFWPFDWELFLLGVQEANISWRTVLSDVVQTYCTNMELCISQSSFFCVAHVMEILKKNVWGNGFNVPLFIDVSYVCARATECA